MKVFSYRFVDPVVRTDTVDGRRFYESKLSNKMSLWNFQKILLMR